MTSPKARTSINLPEGKKVYFLSDFHLGAPDAARSLEREKRIVRFLEEIRTSAHTVFLVGDLFDFWYEYKTVVPRGYVRLLGKLAELSDSGIKLHLFVGNHDMWMTNYFQKEFNIPVYFGPHDFIISDKEFHVAHGDGLGPGDHGYKALKKVFRNPVCRWLFGIFPPQWGMGLANYFSRKSRESTGQIEEQWLGEEKEWLLIYSLALGKEKDFDFFVFGHRHLPVDYRLDNNSRYINLGDWISFSTYAVFDGRDIQVRSYNGQDAKIVRNW